MSIEDTQSQSPDASEPYRGVGDQYATESSVPTPVEAANAEIIKFRQPDQPDPTMTVEQYLVGLLDESHTEEEAKPIVRDLVVEARGSLELARLLAERERLIELKLHPHPSIPSSNQQSAIDGITDELKKLNRQIIELKNELGSNTDTS